MIGDYLEHYFTNNTNMRSQMRTITFEIEGHVFTFFSDLGVFSKDHIDYGSKTLLKTILKNTKAPPQNILDVGCGYGFLGITLSKIYASPVLMTDVNERALHLCETNIKKNNVLGHIKKSNVYENITDKYEMIVTNPPIRAGKKVVLEILLKAKEHLIPSGTLWFVIRKDQGAKSIMKNLEDTYHCQIVKKDKGFYCIEAKIR